MFLQVFKCGRETLGPWMFFLKKFVEGCVSFIWSLKNEKL
jgi:hypothetical protein